MKTVLNTTAVLVLSLCMMGCSGYKVDMYEEGNLNNGRVQVNAESFSDDRSASEVTEGYIAGLAKHYQRYGSGKMDVVVTYDAKSYSNTAMKAREKADDVASLLHKYGVQNPDVGILPLRERGDQSRVIFSYDGYSAAAPEGCTHMLPGLRGDAVEHDPDYKLGCSVETLVAQQVSRPADLMGNVQTDEATDGRSAANIVDIYRSGAPNEPLGGERASGD